MAKIILEVDTKNKQTVLMILENLKKGLIKDIKTEGTNTKYKQVSKKPILEDEFLSNKNTSVSKYLSKSDYKKKLLEKKD